MSSRHADVARARAAIRRAFDGELVEGDQYRIQKKTHCEHYKIGLPQLFIQNGPAGAGDDLPAYIDFQNGAVVYLWEPSEDGLEGNASRAD